MSSRTRPRLAAGRIDAGEGLRGEDLMGRQNAHQMIDTVYAQLHRSILDRRLRRGTKLREVPLGELFGVSRTTIRAALQRLESDGLVTIEPNRGASVTLPSVAEISDLFTVRRIV